MCKYTYAHTYTDMHRERHTHIQRHIFWNAHDLQALALYFPSLHFPHSKHHAVGFPKMASAAAAAKLLQSCPTLCDPTDGSPPGSPVPGILQARTLEWVAIYISNAQKWKVKVKSLGRVLFIATPWTAAYQAALSMGFSRHLCPKHQPLFICHGLPNLYPVETFLLSSKSICHLDSLPSPLAPLSSISFQHAEDSIHLPLQTY